MSQEPGSEIVSIPPEGVDSSEDSALAEVFDAIEGGITGIGCARDLPWRQYGFERFTSLFPEL
jgi:hypothetical protein